MKLLIITQRVDVNDDNLGFFHSWLEKFAERLDKLYVVCLVEGEHHLPANVVVYSLGKDKEYSKLRQFLRLQKFLFKNLNDVDGVFIHMCSIYALIAFSLVRIFRKKMLLWHVHKSVNWESKLAGRLVDKILTASEGSCRLKNRKKIEIVGHGIDVDKFQTINYKLQTTNYKLLSVGRITPIKNQATLIQAIDILVNQRGFRDVEVKIIGSPLEDYEREYFVELKKMVQERKLENYIKFLGSVFYKEMPRFYQNADLVVNLSHTGSIDKVVLESMASGCLVLTSNEAFKNILKDRYLFQRQNPRELAEKIINLKDAQGDEKLRQIVVENHDLDNLIDKIIGSFS